MTTKRCMPHCHEMHYDPTKDFSENLVASFPDVAKGTEESSSNGEYLIVSVKSKEPQDVDRANQKFFGMMGVPLAALEDGDEIFINAGGVEKLIVVKK